MQRDHQLYAAATTLMVAHVIDELFIAKTDPLEPVSATLTLLLIASAVLYGRLGAWRAAPALFFGSVGLLLSVPSHVMPVLQGTPGGSDYTGVVFAAAAAILLALGVRALALTLRGRAARPVAV